jgi:iron complex transport system substrate-binding protein
VIRALLAALMLLAPGGAEAARVVSLNLCTDQYLLALAPEQAAAVTFLARDPSLSAMAKAANAVPTVRADAEAVIALRPDLVLAGPWGARATLAALRRRGLRVEVLQPPADFAAIRAATTRMAALLGVPARGAALLAGMDADLAALPPASGRAAIALEPRGYTAGPGSLRDAVLRAAGLANAALGEQLSLEALATRPRVLLVVAPPAGASRATEWLAHPAALRHPRREVPAALTVCGGPWTARAVDMLAR